MVHDYRFLPCFRTATEIREIIDFDNFRKEAKQRVKDLEDNQPAIKRIIDEVMKELGENEPPTQ